MNRAFKNLLVLFIGAMVASAVICPAVQTKDVLSSAAVPIKNNDLDAARASAVAEAQMRCVKEVLREDLLTPEDYTGSEDQLRALFLDNPKPYLARFSIENESVVDNGQRYQVKVTARVKAKAMKIALMDEGMGDFFGDLPKPSVMVMLKERLEERVSGTHMAQSVLVKELQQRGFKVIDPEQLKLIDLRKQIDAKASGADAALIKAATDLGADYIISGEAIVTSSGPLSGTDLKARYANLRFKIVETSSARNIAEEQTQGKSRHSDELTGGNWALEDAAQKAADTILDRFEGILKEEFLTGTPITVEAYGLEYASQAQELRDALAELAEEQLVMQKYFVPGAASFEMLFKGTSDALVSALARVDVDGEPLQAVDVMPRYIRLTRGNRAAPDAGKVEQEIAAMAREKHAYIDAEKARAEDRQLEAKLMELAQSRMVDEEQRKQLIAMQEELKKRTDLLIQRQEELEESKAKLGKGRGSGAALPPAEEILDGWEEVGGGGDPSLYAGTSGSYAPADYTDQQNYYNAQDNYDQAVAQREEAQTVINGVNKMYEGMDLLGELGKDDRLRGVAQRHQYRFNRVTGFLGF